MDHRELALRVNSWLESKGFETEQRAQGTERVVVTARMPASWKTSIGATPSVEVEVTKTAAGPEIDVRQGKATASTWAKRYFTSSWVAYGASFLSLKQDLEEFVQAELGPTRSPAAAEPKVIGVVETGRAERSLGRDERLVDNSASDSDVTRSIKATKRWSQSCRLEVEKTRTTTGGAEVDVAGIATLKGSMEGSVREHFSMTEDVEQTFEEEITLTVPPRTSMRLIMDWKQILQEGHVQLQDPAGRVMEVPFQVAVGVTFDQRQIG
jgi:hypothetical protein